MTAPPKSHKESHKVSQQGGFAHALQSAWYNNAIWIWLLFPLSIVFWVLSALRRMLYRLNLLKQIKSELPVIIVGNIGIGGNGKTPLTISLVEYLQEQGFTPAVLSRGYGGKQSQFPHMVSANCSAQYVGDEPALIVSRLGCIVVIDPQRVRGCQYIEQNTPANIIICDDGLQHYAMGRDIELCVLDKRGVGNGYLLPMGPLREGKWRLGTVDAIILNQGTLCQDTSSQNAISQKHNHQNIISEQKIKPANTYSMHLKTSAWVNLLSKEKVDVNDSPFSKALIDLTNTMSITAIAGIGDPQRFFDSVNELGISTTQNIGFDDHHAFQAQDIPNKGIVLMTEKDAVKCAAFAHKDCWYLQIDACLVDNFYANMMQHPIMKKAKASVHTIAQ